MANLGTLTIDVELGPATILILELLDVLLDNDTQEDKTWGYCWEELSSEVQAEVKRIREKATLFLAESEYSVTKNER